MSELTFYHLKVFFKNRLILNCYDFPDYFEIDNEYFVFDWDDYEIEYEKVQHIESMPREYIDFKMVSKSKIQFMNRKSLIELQIDGNDLFYKTLNLLIPTFNLRFYGVYSISKDMCEIGVDVFDDTEYYSINIPCTNKLASNLLWELRERHSEQKDCK